MALTEQQITDIRDDIGDNGASEAFTDAEIQRAYERAASALTEDIRQNATRGLLIRQLIAKADKMTDYTAGATGEKLSQIRAQLMSSYKEFYKSAVDAVSGTGTKEAVFFGIEEPYRPDRRYPSGWVHDAPEYEDE